MGTWETLQAHPVQASAQHSLIPAAMMFPMTDGQFQLVYNILSFSLASMMATTLFLWMRAPYVNAKYQTAVVAIQVGYCVSDIIPKCGLGLMIYGITKAK